MANWAWERADTRSRMAHALYCQNLNNAAKRFPGYEPREWPVSTPDSAIFDWICRHHEQLVQQWATPILDTFERHELATATLLEEKGRVAVHIRTELTSFLGFDLHILEQAEEKAPHLFRPLLCIFKLFKEAGVWVDHGMFEGEIDMIESGCEAEDGLCENRDEEADEDSDCNCVEEACFLRNEENGYERMLDIVEAVIIEDNELENWLENFHPKHQGEVELANWVEDYLYTFQQGWCVSDLFPEPEACEAFKPDRTFPCEAIRFIWNARDVWNKYFGPHFDERYGNGSIDPGFFIEPHTETDLELILGTLDWWGYAEDALTHFKNLQYDLIP